MQSKVRPFPIIKFNISESIALRNKNELIKKIAAMINRQPDSSIDLVADYDQTITSFVDEQQKRVSTTFGVFRGSKLSPQNLNDRLTHLFNTYFKYESSNDPYEERYSKTKEWYTEIMKAVHGHHIHSEFLQEIMNDNILAFRYRFDTLFKYSKQNNLNFFIISGGVYDAILYSLENLENLNEYQQLHIIANKLFDNEGKSLGVGQQLVYSYNKPSLLNRNAYPSLNSHCILLGDMITDCSITKEAQYTNQIKIGFIREEQELESYLNEYDIVCFNQGSFVAHEYLLRKILKPNEPIPPDLEENMTLLSKELIEVINEANLQNQV